MYSNRLLVVVATMIYDSRMCTVRRCGGAEKFWSFDPKLPNRPPYNNHSYLSRGNGLAPFHQTIGQIINLQHSAACARLPTSAYFSFSLSLSLLYASKPVTRARRPYSGTSRNKLRTALCQYINQVIAPHRKHSRPRSNLSLTLSDPSDTSLTVASDSMTTC